MATLDDNELPSVRVTIDDNDHGSPTAPALDAVESGTPRWVIGLAVALLAAVAVVVLTVRPDGEIAADGTQRQAPTTTLPDPTNPATTPQDSEGTQADQPPLPPGTLRPIEIDLPQRVIAIVPASPGFLGLSSVDSATPPLLRSVDGLNWFEIDTTASTQGQPNQSPLEWFDLIPQDSGFGVLGYTDSGSFLPVSQVFVSSDGANWEQLDGIGSLSNNPQPGLVVSYDDTSVVSLGLDTSALGRFVEEQTNLVVPDGDRICELQTTGAFEITGYTFLTCNGQDIAFDESNLSTTQPADQILTCLNLLTDVSGFGPWTVTREELPATGDSTVLELLQPNDFPVLMSNSRLAMIDIGSQTPEGFGRCDGIIDAFTQRDPAVVILGGATNEAIRSPFSEVSSREAQVLAPTLAGEVVFESGLSFLIVWIDGDLRAIDTETGRWSNPLLDPGVGFSSGRFTISAAVSDSSNRVYIMGGNELLTVDLVEAEDGTPRGTTTLSPIARENVPELDFFEILHANNDQLFFREAEDYWLLDTSLITSGQ